MSPIRSHTNPALAGWSWPDVQTPGLYYRVMRWGCRMACATLFKTRVLNRHYEPASGGVVIVSNHQSFLDPILVTMGLRRPGNYMARDTLFRNPMFAKLIQSVNAMPIRRGKADTAALKESMRRLKQGRMVLIFPEGTRTRDGSIGPFLPGMSVLSQRAAEWTLPVLIDGAYEAWPRTQSLPSPRRIYVEYLPPIHRDQARRLGSDVLVNMIRERMIDAQRQLRHRLGREPIN